VPEERRNETTARRIVSAILYAPVTRYEDGSSDAMVDAVIQLAEGYAPLEVVGDHDPEFLSLWNALERRGHGAEVRGLNAAYVVQIRRGTDLRTLLSEDGLPEYLRRVEAQQVGISDRVAAIHLRRSSDELGVHFLRADPHGQPGQVTLRSEGWGSGDSAAPDLASWAEAVLARHADVPRKLAAFPHALERHAFLWATISSDYFVQSRLEDRGQEFAGGRDPVLPEGVTHLWIANGFNSQRMVITWFPGAGWQSTPWPDDDSDVS
jgi:hypothetical protein